MKPANPPRRQSSAILRDLDGLIVCSCGCGQRPVRPRRFWFSQACVHSWKERNDPGFIRRKILNRDHGICALCGHDAVRRRREWFHDRTIPRDQTRWEADHVVPVCEGGGQCGIEGYRTLCLPCHRRVTAELAGRRALARRNAPPQLEMALA